MTQRSYLARVMVRQHEISLKLADYHVQRMSDEQVVRELELYVRQGVVLGSELSVEGPNPRAGNVSSTRFSRPATTTAGPRHSTLFPQPEA